MDNRRLFQTVVVRRFLLRSFPWMVAAVALLSVAQSADFAERRQRAANEFHDGILLLHASSELNASADGFHQDPYFYYFTGLENTVGALLAIDGNSNESWLFLPSHPPFLRSGLQPEVKAGADAEKNLALKHVVDWDELKGFFRIALCGKSISVLRERLFSLRRTSGQPIEHKVTRRTGMATAYFAEMARLRRQGGR